MGKDLPFKTPTKQFAAHNQENGNILSHFPLQYKHGQFRYITAAEIDISPTMTHEAGCCTARLIASHLFVRASVCCFCASREIDHKLCLQCWKNIFLKQKNLINFKERLNHFKQQNINLPGAPPPPSPHLDRAVWQWRTCDIWVALWLQGTQSSARYDFGSVNTWQSVLNRWHCCLFIVTIFQDILMDLRWPGVRERGSDL